MGTNNDTIRQFERIGFLCGTKCPNWAIFLSDTEQGHLPWGDPDWVDDGKVAFESCTRARVIYYQRQAAAKAAQEKAAAEAARQSGPGYQSSPILEQVLEETTSLPPPLPPALSYCIGAVATTDHQAVA